MKDNDEFDVLTFFIIVMGVLTAIVGIFAYVLYTKVNRESKNIKSAIYRLNQMKDLAKNDKFQGWILKEQKGKLEKGSATDFQQRIVNSAELTKVHIVSLDPKPPIKRVDSIERPYFLSIKSTPQRPLRSLEPLTKFMYDVEEKWVGAKVKQMRLNWREKEEAWSAELVFSIFKTVDAKTRR